MSHTRFNFRSYISTLLMLVFFIMLMTGLVLYLSPAGRVANSTNWMVLGFGKIEWRNVHLSSSVMFLILSVFHVGLNFNAIKRYLSVSISGTNLRWKEWGAVAFTLLIFISLHYISSGPVFWLTSGREAMVHPAGQPKAENPQKNYMKIAATDLQKQKAKQANSPEKVAQKENQRQSGRGNQSLLLIAKDYQIDLETAKKRLSQKYNIAVEGQYSIRKIAESAGVRPGDIIKTIRGTNSI